MASFRGIKIEDNVIEKDDRVTEEVWFDESTLRKVTKIGDHCFSFLGEDKFSWDRDMDDYRSHHASTGPSVLDLSLLVNCEKIGDSFAGGHFGPIVLPPALKSVGTSFLTGTKCRVLVLPASLESVGAHCFSFATADRILFSHGILNFDAFCFAQSQIVTLEIPGSVNKIREGFCYDATIGTLTFAENNADKQIMLSAEAFLQDATVQTLDLRRSVRLVESDGSPVDESATISVLRHFAPAENLLVDLLANLHGTPHEAAPTDEVSRAAPQSAPESDAGFVIDLAALVVFEDKHRSLVQHDDIIDMSGMVNCRELGAKCFAGLTGVSTLLLPLNLSKISTGFLEDANVPELDIAFPQNVQDVGDRLLHKATVRSVSFAACAGLTTLGCCLNEATIDLLTFPPNLQKVQNEFMRGINAPHLKVEFPNTVQTFEGSILHRAKLRSVDFSNLGERGCAEGHFLERATVEKIVFPHTLRQLSRFFLTDANSPRLDLVFPASLEEVPDLDRATVRSVDCSECREVQEIRCRHLRGARFESYAFPPDVTTINGEFMEHAVALNADLAFPSSVVIVGRNVLRKATVRSVDFSNCAALHTISDNCLRDATVASLSLPPNLRVLALRALKGIHGEHLAIKFPESLQKIALEVLDDSNVKSIDMSAAKSVSRIPPGFCHHATVSGPVTLPPAVTSLETGAFFEFTCAQFRFDAPPSLEIIEHGVFRGANISTVTIIDSPKVKSVGDGFLSEATLETPASLVFTECLTSIGESFCAGATLQRLDMHQCDMITALPDNFLFEADCSRTINETEEASEGCVRLPPNVVTFGDQCFASSKGITNIPARQSALKVGNLFGANSDIAQIQWGGYWVKVGHSFCKDVKVLEIVDAACFSSVGDDFCRGVGTLTVDFSHSAIGTVGPGFLQGASFTETTSLDLSRCSFAECPERFMYQARFKRGVKVVLPAAIASIGSKCCAEVTQLEDFSIAPSTIPQPLAIRDDFLRGCVLLKSMALPSTLTSFGDRCFQDCPALTVSLSLPMVSRIGNDFCATDESSVSGAAPGGSNARMKVSLENVCPQVSIGDNFLAHADCTFLEFGTIGCVAVEKDQLVFDLEAQLPNAHRTSDRARVLKELVALRKVTITKMASATPAFRSITAELSALEAQKDLPDRTERVHALLKELELEEQMLFRHQHEEAREALQRRDYSALLEILKEIDRLVDQECESDLNGQRQSTTATSPESNPLTIGDNFLAGSIGLTKLDMTSALHTAIGNRFAANSKVEELYLPLTLTAIGKALCDGCLATVAAAPQSGFYLSSWMGIRIEKERIDTLVHFRELLPASEQCGMARWLLEQKRFAEFKGVFSIRDDATNLRYVGGSVDDLPEIPDDVAWFGFNMKVSPDDAGLSLLHWAVKHSRQFGHLLSEVSWSLRDLTLVTKQGFTALHYAVLYDIEAAALSTLLSIAAKAEIHHTWSDARSAGGVRVSPLHLAYLYRRDSIVKELLAFEWDPTEAIMPVGDDAEAVFDAFDQSIMDLGQARSAAALRDSDDHAVFGDGSRVPVPVQLFHASILLCFCDALESGLHRGLTTAQGIHRAFVTLRCRLSTDFQLLSPNKWGEARAHQLALAARGSRGPNADDEEFLQAVFAAALSDSAHGPNVRLQFHQLLPNPTSLEAFVVWQVGNVPDVPTREFVNTLSAQVQAMFDGICCSKPSYAAPTISAETLLLRTRSMEEGPHRGKVEDKLAVVIPFRFVIPVLPFFYLMLMVVFGLSWFFHPPILEPTLKGIENAIADCTNPYNTKDATEDGVIPWNCSVGFTELGMQVDTFQNGTEAPPQMASFFSFIEKDKIPQNVTHLPWAYLRFATIVTYNGLKTKASSVADAETTPDDTAQEYWVLTELRKPPEWVPEIFQQKNTKANQSTISFKGETTRTFAHTVVPYQFGNHLLLGAWMAGVSALLLACVAAFVYHGYVFYQIVAEQEVRLVEVTTVQRSLRSILLACELAAVLFIAIGLVIMAVTFGEHKAADLISRSTALQWQRAEIFFRVGLTFCSFRAVSFFSEMPKPHHFAMVNAGVVGVGLIASLVSLLFLPTSRIGIVASLKSLLSIRAVDALTLPVVLAVSLFLRSSKVTDEVRQAHYDNLREDMCGSGRPTRETASCDDVCDRNNGTKRQTEGDAVAGAGDHRRSGGTDVEAEVTGGELLDSLSPAAPANHPSQERVAQRNEPFHTAITCVPDAEELSLSAPTRSELSVSDSAGAVMDDDAEEVSADDQQPVTTAGSDGSDATSSRNDTAKVQSTAPPTGDGAVAPVEGDTQEDVHTTSEQAMKARAAAVRSRARRRWALSWAVILVAGLGQVLLYGLAVTVVVRPLLTLPGPGGVLPVTGDSFLSDDLGIVGFARRFFF